MSKVTFNNKQTPFFTTIKEKVNNYFIDNNIEKTGEQKLYLKSLIQIIFAVVTFCAIIFLNTNPILSFFLYGLLGINFAIIGFNIMHEASHQTFSKYKWVNTFGEYSLNILGASNVFWKIKHNVNHHTFTNIEGMDADIDNQPFLRQHDSQYYSRIHQFQHIYCILLYGTSYFVWVFWNDFQKYFTGKIAQGCTKKLNFQEHLIFWLTKISYLALFVVLPIYCIGLTKALIGFAILIFMKGLSTSLIFQLAHIVEGTSFTQKSSENLQKIEHEWAIHQINTTANFATKNKIITWLVGGLNFQVEHHLFPRISHVHYAKINEYVKETCREYNITYTEYPSLLKALHSHFRHMRKMGNAKPILVN